MAGRPGRAREELLTFTNATISLRWLALASLIALEALLPAPAPRGALLGLYSAIFAYALALTLYVLRYPDRAGRAGRAGVALDTLAIAGGMFLTGHRAEYLFLAFPVAALAGFLLGVRGMVLVTAVVAAAQLPVAKASLFAPDRYLPWAFTVLTMLAAGIVAAAGTNRLSERQQFNRVLADLRRVTAIAPHPAAAAEAGLNLIATHFHAGSGSVMLFDSQAKRLEILAAHNLDQAYKEIRLRLGEGIAGWVAQEGHAVLLSPDAVVPFQLARGDIGSSICIPLIVSQGPLGVLNLNRSPSHERFTHDDLRAAELSAHQLTGVLLQAQSERTVAAALAEMAEGFGEVSRALSRDPAVLWPALLDMARSLTSAHFAMLALEREDTGNMDIVATRGIDGRVAHEFVPTLLAASTHGEIRVAEGGPNRSGVPTSVACVPLRTESQALGAIGLGLPDGRVSARLLNAVASHVAAAVHTARSAYRIADIGVAEERRRIAREMHDGLAQTLADAVLQTDLAGVAAQASPERLADDLKDLRALLERAMRELREFMSELHRRDLAPGTLFAALDGMSRDFTRRYQIPATVSSDGDDAALPSAVQHAVLAIARQALTNVRAHARATGVTIRAEVTPEECTVNVADNGMGFDLSAHRARPPAPHHLGLTSMRERASLVGGMLRIETAPGHGTTITVHVPLERP